MLTVSGSGMSRVFHVTGTTVTIDDITIADGMATDYAVDSSELAPYALGGGLRNIGSNVTLNNVHVVGNTAQNFVAAGGGISTGDSESSTTINGGFFANNPAIAAQPVKVEYATATTLRRSGAAYTHSRTPGKQA